MQRFLCLTLVLIAAGMSFPAAAHKLWLLPSGTTFSGEDAWVSVDAAASNDLFYADHVPLSLDTLIITAPDGHKVPAQNGATGKYRSVFDVELKQTGTYRIAMVDSGLFASWEGPDGKRTRWRGNAAKFAAEVPKNAKDLAVMQSVMRVETFATHGTPTTDSLKPIGEGLELIPVTHPNDLYAGEAAQFKLLLDGKPAPNIDVSVILGGTRYRNAQDEIRVKTNDQGAFTITWPQAGMYWLNATEKDNKITLPQASERRLNYVATLEVLPQ